MGEALPRRSRRPEDYFGDAAGAVVGTACVAGAAGRGGIAWPSRTIVTRLMTTGVAGLSLESRSTRAMEATSNAE